MAFQAHHSQARRRRLCPSPAPGSSTRANIRCRHEMSRAQSQSVVALNGEIAARNKPDISIASHPAAHQVTRTPVERGGKAADAGGVSKPLIVPSRRFQRHQTLGSAPLDQLGSPCRSRRARTSSARLPQTARGNSATNFENVFFAPLARPHRHSTHHRTVPPGRRQLRRGGRRIGATELSMLVQ